MNDWSDIGEKLKEARESRGLSLQDVAHSTRIPVPSLKAIEANCYSVFPSPAYAKSFVHQYADFLEFDADEWLENFKTGNVLANSDGIEYLDESKPKPTRSPASTKRPSSSQNLPRESLGQPLLILSITAILIAAGLWGFMKIDQRLNTGHSEPPAQTSKKENPEPVVIETPRPAIDLSPDPEPAPAPTEPGQTPAFVISDEMPPPRAIIVEDDERSAPLTPSQIAGD
ncbi:helix-turn-helix domain-containing protein [Verrucomicrobiaceae bacterium 227]